MKLSKTQLKVIHDEVSKQYPNEAVIGITKRKAIPLINIHPEPKERFSVDPEEFYQHDFIGLVHSHTNIEYKPEGVLSWHICTPSKMDLTTQNNLDIPFGIIGYDGENFSDIHWFPDYDTPIESRPFIYGIFDCYGVVKYWYKHNRDIILKDVPRDFDDAEINSLVQSLLIDDIGFIEVDKFRELEVGDVIALAIGSKVINHLAVYIGDGRILHHLIDRIPRIDNYRKWSPFAVKHLRLNK